MSVNSHSGRGAEPRKRPQQQRSQEMVDRILGAAARLFDEQGYRRTTTNHIAEAAGCSVGSLYQYFPNKDALVVALAEQHLAVVLPRAQALVDELGEVDDRKFARRLVEEIVALNEADHLHAVLASAPRTRALQERLASVDAVLVVALRDRLVRRGLSAGAAERRARMLLISISAVVHVRWPTADRAAVADDLAAITLGVLERDA